MCPGCRYDKPQRRKRAGIKLYLAGLFGLWPYYCEHCGAEFFLKRRYSRRKALVVPANSKTKDKV
jgi:hypothetical protein